MSKTYDLLADSFTEIINDYKNNNGKNLTHTKIQAMSIMDIDKEDSPWGCFPRKRNHIRLKKL